MTGLPAYLVVTHAASPIPGDIVIDVGVILILSWVHLPTWTVYGL